MYWMASTCSDPSRSAWHFGPGSRNNTMPMKGSGYTVFDAHVPGRPPWHSPAGRPVGKTPRGRWDLGPAGERRPLSHRSSDHLCHFCSAKAAEIPWTKCMPHSRPPPDFVCTAVLACGCSAAAVSKLAWPTPSGLDQSPSHRHPRRPSPVPPSAAVLSAASCAACAACGAAAPPADAAAAPPGRRTRSFGGRSKGGPVLGCQRSPLSRSSQTWPQRG
mmetsp:Transcript_6440/g.14571  ORF Transcript_6440/g.14571 Transcript_6440/m.14571 type:complete len:217 (+) Transcript_6440:695-1345(+)